MIKETITFTFADETQQRRFHECLEGKTPREKLAALREKNDRTRGRPLTASEQIANLVHAVARICPACGGECEPKATCQCGTVNS